MGTQCPGRLPGGRVDGKAEPRREPVQPQDAQGILFKAGGGVAHGPQDAAFTSAGLHIFTHSVYQLTPNCDRMACKLQGPQIETVDGSDIVSDGIVAGSVQVSANGQPIVMLADHQTTGGYAKIATVISADLSAMAQLRPGEKLAFQYVTAAQAVAGARAQAAVLDKIRERMK